MGRSEPKDNVPTIFTSPWMSAGGCRGAPTLLRSLDHRHSEQRSTLLLILLTPSKLCRARDETWPPLPARVTAGTRVPWGGLPEPPPLASPRSALWPLDNEPFWDLWRDQCSHLTPGLTSCLGVVVVWGSRGGGRSSTRLLAVWWQSEEPQFDNLQLCDEGLMCLILS